LPWKVIDAVFIAPDPAGTQRHQGLMLYAAQELSDAWPFRDIGWRYCWYAWVLAIPSAVALSLVELGQRRLWLQAVLGSAVVLALAAWWLQRGGTA